MFNAATSPLAALTGLTVGQVCTDPALRAEVDAPDRRGAGGLRRAPASSRARPGGVGARRRSRIAFWHKPSMLQDVLARRRTEVDVLNGGIAAQGRRVGVPTPGTTRWSRSCTASSLLVLMVGAAAPSSGSVTMRNLLGAVDIRGHARNLSLETDFHDVKVPSVRIPERRLREPPRRRRARALSVLRPCAATLLLAACGRSDLAAPPPPPRARRRPAAEALVFSPLSLAPPALKGLSSASRATPAPRAGGHRPGPELRPDQADPAPQRGARLRPRRRPLDHRGGARVDGTRIKHGPVQGHPDTGQRQPGSTASTGRSRA